MKVVKTLFLITSCLCILYSCYSSVSQISFRKTPVDFQYPPVGSVPTIAVAGSIDFSPNYPIHFIGDSRTVGMQQALTYGGQDLTNHRFTARVGKGYSWLVTQSQLQELPPSILIINLGVNDLGNLKNYQALYETYAQTYWKNCSIYIVSVNPCRHPCTSVSNGQIEAFNTSMQQWINTYNAENVSASAETFPIHYIDTYHMLLTEGYSSSDGLHYSATTYEKIYDYILNSIQESIGDGTGTYTYKVSS